MDADVIVVGASPAGLAASRVASEQGLDVLLMDKQDVLGENTHPANTFFKGMFDRAGETVDDSYVLKNLRGANIVAPSGSHVEVESPAYFLDRPAFDRYYIQKTRDSGVDIATSVEAYNVLKNDEGVSVSTSQGTFDSKLVIISDGINSKLASLCGLSAMKHPDDIGWAMEAEVEGEGIGEADMFEYFVGSVAPGWKSTYSPCGGDRATLGVYVRRHGRDVSPFFDRWVDKFKRMKGLSNLSIGEVKTGGDPIATIPNQMVADGIMLTGGASGQSGIGYSIHGGKMCGKVAAESIQEANTSSRFLSRYSSMWAKEYRTEYYLGRMALETLRKMDDREIDDMMEVFKQEDLSFLRGSSLQKALQVSLFMLKKKPSSLLGFSAFLRNR
ncbi:NAD(P)-binding domain-containing protein [Methanohalophilus sp.]